MGLPPARDLLDSFVADLSLVACSVISTSDDEGETFPATGQICQHTDHQNLFTGPPPEMWPRRLAGTWSRYSKNAIPQLTSTAVQRAEVLYLRWPYHAKVMNTLEAARSSTVGTTGCANTFIAMSA